MLETGLHACALYFDHFEAPIYIHLPNTLITLNLIPSGNVFAAVARVSSSLHMGKAA